MQNIDAAPYDWMNNPMVVSPENKYKPPYRAYTEKNPYEDGSRTYDNRGNVWYTDVNPYDDTQMRTRRIH